MNRRRPPWRLLLAVILAAWAFWASPALADRLQEIRDRGQLVVGVKEDYAPFGFRDADGALVGYDVDVARGFADAIGVELQLVPVTSANRMQKVERGEIDIVAATMGDTRSRRELVTMIEPQYYGDGANVLLRDDAKIGSWADLRGGTVCGLQGSLWNRLAKQRLLLDVTAFNSTRETGQALRNGHCVGWIYDEVLLLPRARDRRVGGLQRLPADALRAALGRCHRQGRRRRPARPADGRYGGAVASRGLPAVAGTEVGPAAVSLPARRPDDLAGD